MACVSVIGTEAAASPTTLADVISAAPIFHSAVQVHNPYQISWDATDKATLSPTPPDFTYGCTATLRTWIPGESVGSLPCNNKHDNLNIGNTGLFFFVVIGVPIIAVVLIATCCGIYCRKARRIRRGRDEQRRTVHQPPQPVAPAAEPDVHLNNVKA
ncbi:hypothetical protein BCR34DRAFT_178637 [Clohesyomyces aquaticus]|uniref:Uncharacterized protein n=1 Tax=Clohesyomyces aquaticus TaxID=1231657 RepID=A0A1Y1ZZ04_9PLEO|nr:hypothetical protein BCR34DRAFT_178637 [Clohesyomyces aquaticus]